MEVVPINSTQKHDPAWKHCQMIKSGDRTQLKCIYCGKIFSGGGIHRIKEHLAGQKGNAASCLRVHPDVRCTMQQSLDGVIVKKKKKQKIAEGIRSLMPTANALGTFTNQSEIDTGLQLLSLPDGHESNSILSIRKEDRAVKISERRKKGRMKNSSPPPMTSDLNPAGKLSLGPLKASDQVNMAIARFLYDVGVPLDAVNSVYFQPMIDAIASVGPGLEAPSYHDIRGRILKNSIEEVRSVAEQFKCTWGRTGCSIMADEWKTQMGKTLINFLVYCPEGTLFLKSVDASSVISSIDSLYELLKGVVEEIGFRNVVQVITNNNENYIAAGKRLMETFPTLFCTPCAARCINSMLDDIGKFDWINLIIEQSKSITKFIYNHGIVLNMMRKYTGGKELLYTANTQFATDFIALQSMLSLKDNLKAMVTSQEWMNCPYSKKPIAVTVADLICRASFWSACGTIIRLTEPLVRLLRVVSNDRRPSMGYLYAGMYRAKEAIKKESKKKRDYMLYWNIIDCRWDRHIHGPLHAAAFFLNPHFFYSIEGDVHNEIMSGVLDCIERLVPESRVQDKINKELSSYKNATGDFGRKMAIRARHTLLPADWWSTYGGGCPNLTRLAIRILSQTCSASGCKRELIPFELIHNCRINRLEHQRLKDLVFVQYNLRLQQRQQSKNRLLDPISIDTINILENWVKDEPLFEEDEDLGWMAVDQPVANCTHLESANNYLEGAVVGFEDEEIYDGVKDEEEEDDGR